MGPSARQDGLMRDVAHFKRTHPEVIIKGPGECPSGMWEVSFPASATIAFDNPGTMLQALSMIGVPDDDDDSADEPPGGSGAPRSGSETA
jgi:hypothetical protein